MSDTQTQVIEPDPAFVTQIMESGGETLQKCFQCGNCSVVCNISPDNVPYPRKEMIWAQWGLKDKLMADADAWLCHQCNDCSTHCPRGANPGDVMAAIRNIHFSHYGAFGLGKLWTSAKYLPLLFVIPAVWIAIVIAIASKSGFMSLKPIVFSNMMPVPAIDTIFLPAVGFAAVAAFIGLGRFWKAINEASPGSSPKKSDIVTAVIKSAIGVLKHEKMGQCGTNGPRFKTHLATMYGFFALVATTTAVALMYWINKLGIADVATTPLPLSHPVKLLGNIGALMAVVGVTGLIVRRFGSAKEDVGVTGYYDKHFIMVLFWTIVTGILSEMIRLADISAAAFGMYYIHLIFVFVLLAYAPFSKFAHMFYRFTALTYANTVARDRARDNGETDGGH